MSSELFSRIEELINETENGNPFSAYMLEWMRLIEAKVDGQQSIIIEQQRLIADLQEQFILFVTVVSRVPDSQKLISEVLGRTNGPIGKKTDRGSQESKES